MADEPTLQEHMMAIRASVDACVPVLQRIVDDMQRAFVRMAEAIMMEAIKPALTIVGTWYAEIEREAAKYNLSAEEYFVCTGRAKARYDIAYYEWGMGELVSPEPQFEDFLEQALKEHHDQKSINP